MQDLISRQAAIEACLPYFKAGTMYNGMEKYKDYALEELGL